MLHSEGLDAYVVRRLDLPFRDVDWDAWHKVTDRVHNPTHRVEVALVGKYIDLPDAYLSVTEALRAGGFDQDAKVTIRWVTSDDCQTPEGARLALEGADAILVPGGFGVRGIEGKLGALRYARENRVPTLGICLGLQTMVIEYARTVLGLADASSSEFEPGTTHPVVATMAEQLAIVGGEGDLGGTMRLGSYEAVLTEGSVVAQAYGADKVTERHRHRYEVNNAYRAQLEAAGLVFSGVSPDGRARGVRRAAARRAPVLRLHPGAPGVQVAADVGTPPVRGPHRGGAGPPAGGRRGRDDGRRPPRRTGRCSRPRRSTTAWCSTSSRSGSR